MKWSKLKQLVEQRVAPSLQNKFAINSTAYGACSCGHAWITIEKNIIANFCTRAFWNRKPEFNSEKGKWLKAALPKDIPQRVESFYNTQDVEYGELSRQDAYVACWDFVHNLSVEDALISEDPLIQSLAVIDSRIGKRRLLNIETDSLHPLAFRLYNLRLEAENILSEKN